ncbi:MAG TPA: SRPBCC family protein [Devosia sp.]
MSFDIAAHLGAMTREVRNLERDGQPAKAVVASRVYPTDAADLWDALTNSERLPRWFAQVDGDLRLGGRFHVHGNAEGTITACEPQKHIAGTWEFAGATSWIEIDLTPDGDGTRLQLVHTAHISPHWDMFGPGAVGVGWELGFLGLSAHLAAPESDVRAEGTGWETSEEAKGLVRASSAAWGEAAINAGENREHALAAAEATRKFYSGEAPTEM